MPQNKLPTNQSLEDLLKILESADTGEEVLSTSSNDVISFISVFNLQPGTNPVKTFILWSIYNRWSSNKVEKHAFFSVLDKIFLKTTIKGVPYYYLNLTALKVTEALLKYYEPKRDKLKNKNYHEHFNSFLKHYSIEKGSFWYPSHALYHLYDKWTYKIGTKRPLSFIAFNKFCRLYFEVKNLKVRLHFSVFKHLTKEEIKQITKGRREKIKRTKKQKQTI